MDIGYNGFFVFGMYVTENSVVLDRLLEKQAFRPRIDVATGVEVDYVLAHEVLEEHVRTRQSLLGDSQPRASAALDGLAPRIFRFVVGAFDQRLDLGTSLVSQMTRVVGGDSFEFTDGDCHEFEYWSDRFPRTRNERGRIRLSYRVQNCFEERLPQMFPMMRSLPEHVRRNVALAQGIGHEVGHAIAKTLELVKLEKAHTFFGLEQPAFRITNQIDNDVYTRIAPDPWLHRVFVDEPIEGTYVRRGWTTAERVASGFEVLALQHCASMLGMDEQEVLVNRQHYDERRRGDWNQILGKAKNQGLGMNTLGAGLDDLVTHLCRTRSVGLHHEVPKVGAKVLGYCTPLSELQLREYVQSNMISD